MKYFIGFIIGILMTISVSATAGWLSSGIGGAVGSYAATAGIEGKGDSINARIEALTRALDSVKVCK